MKLNLQKPLVIFDLETGYYLELIVASEERVLELAEAFGIDIG